MWGGHSSRQSAQGTRWGPDLGSSIKRGGSQDLQPGLEY